MREESSASAMVAEPGASTTLDLGAVAPGRYALVVWHDIDRDGEFRHLEGAGFGRRNIDAVGRNCVSDILDGLRAQRTHFKLAGE